MKTRLMEQSEHKSLSEFDPPPLLERTVELEAVGLKEDERFYIKERPLLKVVGGFHSQTFCYNLCRPE